MAMHAKSISLKSKLFNLIPKKYWLYRLCKHYVDIYDGNNNDDIFTNGELNFLRSVLSKCCVVFDIGANIGDWTELCLNINPLANVHCFEPSSITYQLLQKRAFPPQVICNHLGLSSKPAEMSLFVFHDGAGINSLYRRYGLENLGLNTQDIEEKVYVLTIDEYCQKNNVEMIDFIKIDVEGHELEVFKGASKMLKNGRIKIIQFEYGGTYIDARVLLSDLFNFLTNFDYTLYKIYPNKIMKYEKYEQHLENFQYQNWVALLNSNSDLFLNDIVL